MMKKALIVTLFDEYNIGNRLQNYALQEVLLSHNVEVTVLDNGYTSRLNLKVTIKKYVKGLMCILGFNKYKREYLKFISDKKRRNAIKRFNSQNIKNVLKVENKQSFKMDWSAYDIAIAGSDQIWHKWRNDEFELPFYYLQFLPGNKRTAYAASFGFEEIPLKDICQHEQGLKGMKYISCRETTGCRLATSIISKEVPQVLDPTLLLSASKWRSIAAHADEDSKNHENYAFVYFLGERTDEYNQFMLNLMETDNIKSMIDFSDIENKDISGRGPSEFLSLIDNAEFVFTDSFHCVVFALIFEKRFTVFRRVESEMQTMFGRIEDLLASKGKLDCIYGGSRKNPTNDFNKLYNNSMEFIDLILDIT